MHICNHSATRYCTWAICPRAIYCNEEYCLWETGIVQQLCKGVPMIWKSFLVYQRLVELSWALGLELHKLVISPHPPEALSNKTQRGGSYQKWNHLLNYSPAFLHEAMQVISVARNVHLKHCKGFHIASSLCKRCIKKWKLIAEREDLVQNYCRMRRKMPDLQIWPVAPLS